MRIGTGIGIPFNLGTPLESFIRGLFTANEQGTWYDPSDLTTLYQDSAGTTPVTAVEQPVGLMLDKSKGLVLGPELVTNGTFDSNINGWGASTPATIAWQAGSIRVTKASTVTSYPVAFQDLPLVSGRAYKLTCNYSNPSGATVHFSFNGVINNWGANTSGSINFIIFATGSTTRVEVGFSGMTGSIGQYIDFDNISVRELPGNHAYQTTTTSRPVLSARYNLLTKTEQFDDAAWTKLNAAVTANAIVSPDGTLTADKLIESTNTGGHNATQNPAFSGDSAHTVSFYAKAGERSSVQIDTVGTAAGSSGIRAVFNLVAGTAQTSPIGSPAGTGSASITGVGDGWYRCSVTATPATTGNTTRSTTISIHNGTTNNYTGDGYSGIYIWGASLVPTNQASLPYQRVNTATDYDTVGFKPYLKFDGVDDFLQTNSIDFTSTDKMHVCAGVRKLANGGMIFETSTDSSANNGAMWMYAGTPSYEAAFRGTVFVNVTATGISPPRTDVLSSQGSITPANNVLRVNGTQAAQSTATQGTGNYGNYPLYIGRRGGTVLPFNGQLYGLVIRGAASTDAQIAATERYINSKTGAY